MKDKRKTRIILGIAFLVVLLLGGTYAWLRISISSNEKHVIHAGKLDLILYDDDSDGINIKNAVPVSDAKGKDQEGYKFQLINRGTLSSRYALYLDDLTLDMGEERMPDSIVGYTLEKDGEEIKSGLINNMGSNPNRVLDEGTIDGKTTYNYTLKVWMDKSATMEHMNTVFYTKIRAEAEQTNMPIKKGTDLYLTPESKEKVPIKEGENPRKYTYTSSDWNVVTVDEDGNIEVVGPGTAIITKTDQTGEKEEITVHVTVPVTAEFTTSDKITSIGNTDNIACNLTENNQTTCQIDLPEVEVVDGYEFVGWSTNPNAHEGKKEKMEISLENKILYPIIKIPGKQLTASIVKQGDGVEGIETDSITCDVKDNYNNETPNTSCEITLPNITAKEGYEIIGWSTDSGATTGIAPGSKVEISGDTTYYTIYKKLSREITATFMINGAKNLRDLNGQTTTRLEDGSLKITCTVPESYNGVAEDSCEITVPEIEASDATPNVIGFNEDITAIVPSISNTITISKNKTYYALTKSGTKECTATFYRNGAKSLGGDTGDTVTKQCNMEITYNGTPQVGCNIEAPSIEASTNTPEVLGYSAASGIHEEDTEYVSPSENILITENVSYYAQTANKNLISYGVTYQKGSHVVNIAKDQDACQLPPSYNGEKRSESCTVEAPDYTVDEGYRKVGYNEEKDAKEGVFTTLTLTKENTVLYANATKTTITIEYYHNGESVGASFAEPGESITLTDYKELGIEKRGYTFKGWDTEESATTVQKGNEDVISGLEEGNVMKLYAVWVDDIRPICTISADKAQYTVGDIATITITCTDEGSGFDDPGEEKIDNLLTKRDIILKRVSNKYTYSSEKIVATYEFETLAAAAQSLFIQIGIIYDKSGNTFGMPPPNTSFTIMGKTFTATMTAEGVEGVSLGANASTTKSCITVGSGGSCSVNLGTDVVVEDGYRWAGWNTNSTARSGVDEDIVTLTDSGDDNSYASGTKFYPVVGPIFEEAYRYNQDLPEGTQGRCITGEEGTCEPSDCYDGGECSSGTIFKYAVKSDDNTNHRVASLDDYVYYFHVLHDDGDRLTLQQRENLIRSAWSSDGIEITEGPITAINALKNETGDWSYVEDLDYTYGETPFEGNASTGCDYPTSNSLIECNNSDVYRPIKSGTKARLVTVQELQKVGCSKNVGDGPLWTRYDMDNNESQNRTHYWTSNAHNDTPNGQLQGMALYCAGNIVYLDKKQVVGIRPVIELSKTKLAEWKK